jgi:hypothetical protein
VKGTWAALVLLGLVGCGSGGRTLYPVSGKVTMDGKKVEQGDILFIPEDPRWGPECGRISAGEYRAQVAAGRHRVEITALDIGPQTRYLDGSPLASNFIPERYNARSELRAEVREEANTLDFSLGRK